MEKRVVFRSAWLPYALVAPQIAITLLFFFWPATQALWYSFQLQDAFGFKTQFVGLANFAALFRDGNYLASFKITALFSLLVAFFGIAISLLLATMADRVIRGAMAYKTLLIWPYAVAPAVAGGNSCVVLASQSLPLSAVSFAEVLHACAPFSMPAAWRNSTGVGGVLVTTSFVSPDGDRATIANLWNDHGFFATGFMGVVSGFQIAFFAFVGVELVGTAAAETANPRRTLPRAINAVPLRVAILPSSVIAHLAIIQGRPAASRFKYGALRS